MKKVGETTYTIYCAYCGMRDSVIIEHYTKDSSFGIPMYAFEINGIKEAGMETETIFEIGDIKAVNNKSLERVQIIFSDKPEDEIRSKLKQQAFRWAPSNNAWQRKNTGKITGTS